MHCGRLGPAAAAVMDLFLQRITSSGAFSSDCAGQRQTRVWGGGSAAYQVEAEQQRAQRCNKQDVDKIARQVAEPRARAHGCEGAVGEQSRRLWLARDEALRGKPRLQARMHISQPGSSPYLPFTAPGMRRIML